MLAHVSFSRHNSFHPKIISALLALGFFLFWVFTEHVTPWCSFFFFGSTKISTLRGVNILLGINIFPRICRIKGDNEGRSSWWLISSTICLMCSSFLRASYFGCLWICLTNILQVFYVIMRPRALLTLFVQKHRLDTSKPALSPLLLFIYPADHQQESPSVWTEVPSW